MSGNKRDWSSTEASIFLFAACVAALSSTSDNAPRPISNTGMEACDIEKDMRSFLESTSAGLSCRLRSLHFCESPLIKSDEIDRMQHQRWKSAVGNGV